MQEILVRFLGWEDLLENARLPTPVFLGFAGTQLVKNPPAVWETCFPSLVWEDPLEKGTGYSLQYSGLDNSIGYSMGLQRVGHHWDTVTFTLPEINIVTSDFFYLVLPWYNFPHPFICNLYVYLYLKWISCRQYITASYVLINSLM